MKKFRVIFNFDKENSKTLLIKSASIEDISEEIINSSNRWFTHIDEKGVGTVIQLGNVNSFNVIEYKSL
ncbi:hypothetical protein C9414_06015 [Bacillus sp. Nf3]|uniref:hypothetical protein n=1 Tax=Bacillus TaxID=1386 RepID=UPI000D15CC95|nr:hypothetical protein [Bacillus sp. Nf3]PTA85205.1 hypothetical protein C9414_06015 [Bacillus sp. Nf3]